MRVFISLLYPFEDVTKEFSVSYEAKELDGYPVLKAEPFTLALTYHKNHLMDFQGEGNVVLSIPCDRCLKPVSVTVPFVIDMKVNLDTKQDEDHEDVYFLSEDELDVDLLIEPEIQMGIPMKVLCKEDCKGICEKCGADLNEGPCSCDRSEAPTPMAEALMKALQNSH